MCPHVCQVLSCMAKNDRFFFSFPPLCCCCCLTQYSVVATAITYGTMFGLGTALAYTPPLGVAMRWFPKSKGLVNGIIVGGFGLGAFIFNQIQTAYLNPTNKDLDDGQYFSDDKILDRVPSVFLMLGSIYTIVQVRFFLAVFICLNFQRHFNISCIQS